MRQEGEPSVEEILESIKRVIARDNAGDARSTGQRRRSLVASSEVNPALSNSEEILDLGMVGSPLQDNPDEDDLIEDGVSGGGAPVDADLPTGLTTDRAADAMRQSLAALAILAEPPARPKIVRQGETSLEGMVRDMLRPMLAQWLDANLPGMVEDLVKAEIARIAGKQR